MRIVSVCPSNTEIACALGLSDELVALDDDSDFPKEVQHLPRVGKDLQIDAAKVESHAPDLVLASLSVPGMERVVESLRARRLPVLVLDARGWQAILDEIRLVGERTGRTREAREIVESMQSRLSVVAARTRGRPVVPFYFEWWPPGPRMGPIVPTRDTWVNDLAAAAGGRHVFADAPGASMPVDPKDVFARRFDHVFVCWCGTLQRKQSVDRVAGRAGWTELPAVKAGRIHLLDEGVYGRPGPRVVEGAEEMGRILHPDA
ncbi:MAG TPA: cobalamin-binding protein [Candidatus Thermoplasmatota archaeon]|nr:cobalamin-binding protein [Candidatus Thermoplasmatota archaeon]